MRRARMTRSQWGIRDQDYGVSPSCGVASKHQNGHEQVLGTYPNQVRWARIQNCVQKSCTPDDLLEIAQHQIGTSQACRGSHWGLYFLVGTRLQWRPPPPQFHLLLLSFFFVSSCTPIRGSDMLCLGTGAGHFVCFSL